MQIRQRKRKIPKVFFIVAGIVLLIVIFFIFFKFFAIKSVNVSFLNAPCIDKENILRKINLFGKNIFTLQENIIVDQIKKIGCISDASILKKLPSSVEIKLKSREPALLLHKYNLSSTSGTISVDKVSISTTSADITPKVNLTYDRTYVLDNQAVVMSTNSSNLNINQAQYLGNNFKLYQDLGEPIIRAENLIYKFKKTGLNYQKSLIVQSQLMIFYSKPAVVFSLQKDEVKQITSLQLILNQAKMNSNKLNPADKNSKEIIKIDLRYDKPVLLFSN